MASSCFLEMHFKNKGYFHRTIRFYSLYIQSFIFNETDVLLMLCCECGDIKTAVTVVSSYICVLGQKMNVFMEHAVLVPFSWLPASDYFHL